MIGIVVSHADEASTHVGEHLLDIADWRVVEQGVYRTDGFELREFDDWHLELDGVAAEFDDPDCIVFASRHSGETGKLLSAHYTGNFGAAEYGGSDGELAEACPAPHKQVMNALERNAADGWDVAMECTHHGPSAVGAPSMFVEVGSSEAEWQDPAGARAVAKSILEIDERATAERTVVAFGGNHYAPKPTRIVTETDAALGHVAADWSIEELGDPMENRDVVEQMFEKSGATCAVFEDELPAIRAVVDDLGYRIVSEKWIRETEGRSLDLISTVEGELSSVDEGLRFGAVFADDAAVSVRDLPDGLLAECHGTDPVATREAVRANAVAYETRENGNRVEGRAAFASGRDYDGMITGLMDVLASAYESVTREGDEVVAVRDAFDPESAAELGVPEGPKFGKLAAGTAVTVDGDRISPEQVETREIRRFAV